MQIIIKIILVILVIFIIIKLFPVNFMEPFSSDEAIQNIASLYNSSNMTVTNLNVTGNLVSQHLDKKIGELDIKLNAQINKLGSEMDIMKSELGGNMEKFKLSFNRKKGTQVINLGNKKCNASVDCAQNCPNGYYMSGLAYGKYYDWKHPVCSKFI